MASGANSKKRLRACGERRYGLCLKCCLVGVDSISIIFIVLDSCVRMQFFVLIFSSPFYFIFIFFRLRIYMT